MAESKLSPDVAMAVERIGTRLDGVPLVLMLDVDGTLAPIASTPTAAAVPVETRHILERLAAMDGVTVALVSGRAAQDAQDIARVAGAWVIGNHGYELMSPRGELAVDQRAAEFEHAVAEAARQLSSVRMIEGALLENKRWTLSVHYRNVTRGADELKSRARAVAAEQGLRVTEGKKVVELRPPVDVDKGTAALDFARRRDPHMAGAALYAGDDRTDEDAFRALRPVTGAVTVRIGAENETATSAELALSSPVELRELLGWLLTRRQELA